MTLDEQMEWLKQKANDENNLANDYFYAEDRESYENHQFLESRYLNILESLKDYKELKQPVIGVVSKKLDRKIKDTPPTEIINILIKNMEDFEAGEASTSYMLNDKYKVTITVEDIEE